MFISFLKRLFHRIQLNKELNRWISYSIVVFLIMQCCLLPFASENVNNEDRMATIGDATWTTADKESELTTEECLDTLEETAVYSAASDLYYIEPDRSNPFVAYAMTIPKASGINQPNLCATYVSQALYGYYGKNAPVSGMTGVGQITNQLDGMDNWKCVYSNANCFASVYTDAQYDSLFDSLTNSGDLVIFVNKSVSDQVHCGIAGGGSSLIGHLTSSGWDSIRASYYLSNAVDTRKICTGMMIYRYKEAKKFGTLRICKNYDEELYRTNPELFDVGGANYGVYANKADAQSMKNAKGYCYVEPGKDGQVADDNVSKNICTKLNGEGDKVQLSEGTYYIREVVAPTKGSWLLDSKIYETKVYAGKRTTFGLPRDKFGNALDLGNSDYMDRKVLGPEEPYLGYICLLKQIEHAYKDTILENENYDFSGIEYTVYRVSGDQQYSIDNVCGRFCVDKQGEASVVSCKYNSSCVRTKKMALPVGWYMVQETKTNASMDLNSTPKWIKITAGKTEIQTIVMDDPPKLAKPNLLLRKYGEDEIAVAHAKYKILYYTTCTDYDPATAGKVAQKSWVFQTDEQGELRFGQEKQWFVEGDPLFLDQDGNVILPAGTITIQEIEAPAGYLVDPQIYVKKITPGDTLQTFSMEQVITVEEKLVRGDLEFQKVDEQGNPLANMKFSITDENGESHIVWTDENGFYSTSSSYISHKKQTNSDQPESGIWFGMMEVDDTVGALPYGIYVIEELRCDANKNSYRSMEPVTVEITENNTVVKLGEFVNYRFPVMKTKAEYEGKKENITETDVVVTCMDRVSLTGLEIGHTYKIEGEPHRKDTGEVLDTTLWSCEKQTLKATDATDEIDIIYQIHLTEDMYDTEIVFFERMTDEAYPDEIVACHEDINDMYQTIYIPKMDDTTETTETTVAGTSTEKGLEPIQPSNHQVRTGDESNIFLSILLISTSALGIGMFLAGRKKHCKKK